MNDNGLCGLNRSGHGTYSAEGINKLCEGLKGSILASLRCAETPNLSSHVPSLLHVFPCFSVSSSIPVLVPPMRVPSHSCHAPWRRSIGFNNITGEAAENLAKTVLEHKTLTSFCGIPLVALRGDNITELNLNDKGIGMAGAIVLSKLLPSAEALTSLR